MPSKQGDVSLLDHPIAQELLQSTVPARVAYTWKDGTPRVVPIWFHWNGKEVVLGSPPKAPKVIVLPDHSHVALTIDSNPWPPKVLLIRGIARVEIVNGVSPEYAAAAERYGLRRDQIILSGGTGACDVFSHGPYCCSAYMGGTLGLPDAFSKCN